MVWCARAALVGLLLMSGSGVAVFAQRVCSEISAGETVAGIAIRLTGDPRHRHAPWFQIVDRHWRAVAKADYDRIQAGWLACVDPAQPAGSVLVTRAGPPAVPIGRSRVPLLASVDFTFLAVGAVFLAAAWVMRLASRYAGRRRARVQIMRRFGHDFVREFGRPLTQFRGTAGPPRARLRLTPRRSQMEVLLAPAGGGSYPNLSDHRGNVEYDVERVMAALRRESFVGGTPYTEGPWVVLPFEFRGSVEQEVLR